MSNRPGLRCCCRDGAVCAVCGDCVSVLWLLLVYEDGEAERWRESWGVRYGTWECEEELLDEMSDSVGARLRSLEWTLCARASSMISGSSSVMPFSMSAKMDIKERNSCSVSDAVEKRAYSYCARNVGPSVGGLRRPNSARRAR